MGWWLHAFYNWLKEVRYFWLTLFLLSISLLIIFIPGTNELRIRVIGLILQLFGLSTVAWGIRTTRQFFGYPGFLETVIRWLRSFPRHRPVFNASLSVKLPMLTMRGSAHKWISPSDESSESRLSAVEENLIIVNERVTHIHELLDKEIRVIRDSLHLEKTERESQDQEIRRTLELRETGGLNISLMGLVWLVLGIIMSTIPNEIANILK